MKMQIIEKILNRLFESSKKYNLNRWYILKIFGYAVFIHQIKESDEAGFHTHPWNGISLIFGEYQEELIGEEVKTKRFFNYVQAKKPHRVMISKPVWTIFIHGRRCNRWAVYDVEGNIVKEEPWRGISPKQTRYIDE